MTTVKIEGLDELQSKLNELVKKSTSEWLKARQVEYPAPIEMKEIDGVFVMYEESEKQVVKK